MVAFVAMMTCALWAGRPLTPACDCNVIAEGKRRSVLDYYQLLPALGIDLTTRQEKQECLQPSNYHHPIIDIHHDYLRVYPDSSPPEEIAVFRAHGKADLLATSLPDSECDYNDFCLYRLRHGRLQDVTSQMIPILVDTDNLLYELPRFGTTIRVFRMSAYTETGRPLRHVFDLQWHKGRFVKAQCITGVTQGFMS